MEKYDDPESDELEQGVQAFSEEPAISTPVTAARARDETPRKNTNGRIKNRS